MTQGETQIQTQEADGWSLRCLIIQKGVGKRMVVDRQKVKPVQSPGGTEWQTGSRSREAEWSGRHVQSPEQARIKTGRTRKRRMQKAGEREKTLVDLETYKTNWHRETGNTGINTLGETSNTWRGWRQ